MEQSYTGRHVCRSPAAARAVSASKALLRCTLACRISTCEPRALCALRRGKVNLFGSLEHAVQAHDDSGIALAVEGICERNYRAAFGLAVSRATLAGRPRSLESARELAAMADGSNPSCRAVRRVVDARANRLVQDDCVNTGLDARNRTSSPRAVAARTPSLPDWPPPMSVRLLA